MGKIYALLSENVTCSPAGTGALLPKPGSVEGIISNGSATCPPGPANNIFIIIMFKGGLFRLINWIMKELLNRMTKNDMDLINFS